MQRLVAMTVTTTRRRVPRQVIRLDENIMKKASTKSSSSLRQFATFKPWKTHMIESHGDYTQEAFLEEHIGGPLYEHQHELPKLPVPSIQDTISRLLPTALPLAKTEQEKMNLKEACAKFPEQAKVLQERLVHRREKEWSHSSWLQRWWNQMGYLQVRDPVTLNVSYYFDFFDDPTIDATGSKRNIQRAATMLYASAEYRKLVCSGQKPQDKVGKKQTPLCSAAYKYMFNACRIPHREQDSYKIYDPSRYHHCIVSRNGHFFSFDLVDSGTADPVSITQIEDCLQKCIDMASEVPTSTPKFGLMTSGNRDDWADARESLLSFGGITMEEALEKLQTGALLVCLDNETPVSRQECGVQYLTGGLKSGENRWYDKSIQLLISENGKAGLVGEHSMMDGMPVLTYMDYVTKQTYTDVKKRSSSTPNLGTESVSNIFAKVAPKLVGSNVVEQLQTKAWNDFYKLVTDHELRVQSFNGYGSSFIKQSGHSPDAFVQIAMNLATYRLFGEQAGTYEATQVRPFLHGRTETTRTVSLESEAFIKQMGLYPKMDEHFEDKRKEKLALLQAATNSHAQYTKLASTAQGVDRHLFGLSLLVKDGETAPQLYSDPVFIRSKTWRVSTSNMSHPSVANWGYGEVVPDGVGLSYSIHARSLTFSITSLKKHEWAGKLSRLLEEALLEMRTLIEMDKPPISKL